MAVSSAETPDAESERAWRVAKRLGASAFVVTALSLYESDRNREILGRWSVAFAILFLGVVVVAAVYAARGFRRGRLSTRLLGQDSVALLETALLFWAAARLVEGLNIQSEAGALLDGNLIGSKHPAGVALDWLAVVTVFVSASLIARRIPRRWQNLALAAGSFAALALAGEGIARLVAVAAPQVEGLPTNRQLAWLSRYVSRNESGFRDAPVPVTAGRAGRVLGIVGDSYAFGWGIRDVNDRVGELLVRDLRQRTNAPWRSVNTALTDQHTLQEFALIDSVVQYRPSVIVLLYVFNDIDYLQTVTPQNVVTTHGTSRLHPLRLLFTNSYLFQQAWLRMWQLRFARSGESANASDPYGDADVLARHIADLGRLVEKGRAGGRAVVVVPFDISTSVETHLRTRYDRFVCESARAGVPVVSVRDAFDGHAFETLRVNQLDSHPNELANRLLATKLAPVIADIAESDSAGVGVAARAIAACASSVP